MQFSSFPRVFVVFRMNNVWFSSDMEVWIGEFVKQAKEKFYVSLVVVATLSSLGTYFWLKGGDSSNDAILIDDGDTSEAAVIADISGAIKNPGVYELPPGARIVDLVKAGGGILKGVSKAWVSKNLNLSTKLEDAQKVYIPFEWELEEVSVGEGVSPFVLEIPSGKKNAVETSPEASEAGKGNINVNIASQEKLEELPRVGEVTAQRIMDNRPYKNLSELSEKADLSKNVMENITPLIVFE